MAKARPFSMKELDPNVYDGEHDLALQADGGKATVKSPEVIEQASILSAHEKKTAD